MSDDDEVHVVLNDPIVSFEDQTVRVIGKIVRGPKGVELRDFVFVFDFPKTEVVEVIWYS